MMKKSFIAALALLASSVPAIAEEVAGYGPWRLGMSREEVAAVASHGPYSAVTATGGVETRNAQFQGTQVTASFVFGPHGLRHIQVWAYEGQDLAAAVRAFHSVYAYLAEHFGPLHSDGVPVAADLSAADLERLLPVHFKTGASQSQLPELPQRGSIQAAVHKFHLHPQAAPVKADVYGSFIHSPQLGLYWVFVYFKSPTGRP